jgi:hypothetical protein
MDESLTEPQKNKLCWMALLGCDRATLSKYVGVSPERLQRELLADADFARDLLHAEAEAELRHMGNVHRASQDEKHWRTSVWWLERRAKSDLAAPDDAALPPEVCAALEQLAEIVVAEITDPAARQSLRRRLMQVVELSRGTG